MATATLTSRPRGPSQMSRVNFEPSYVLSMARSKAMQESARPEYELRLLLAHVTLLDKLDHCVSEVIPSKGRSGKAAQRPTHQRRQAHRHTESHEKDDYDSYHAPVATVNTMISVEEVEDDEDDWIGR